jgi:hypothetical protein
MLTNCERLNQWRRVADALPPARRARLLATITYISHVYQCESLMQGEGVTT